MSNVIEMSPMRGLLSAGTPSNRSRFKTTADFRRLLSEMRLRPPSQRAFLRKLLKRAAVTGAPMASPVHVPVVLTP
jgi:hypothetical protein